MSADPPLVRGTREGGRLRQWQLPEAAQGLGEGFGLCCRQLLPDLASAVQAAARWRHQLLPDLALGVQAAAAELEVQADLDWC